MKIITRGAWGAKPWSGPVHAVGLTRRRQVVLHYHGDVPAHPFGPAMAQEVDDIHHANGWAGVGYNFLIDGTGSIFEGRGQNLVGAHCPGLNLTGFGIYFAIGGKQKLNPAMRRSGRVLYEYLNGLTGRQLIITTHGANYATECPGDDVASYAQAGMPYSSLQTPKEGLMAAPTARQVADALLDTPVPTGEKGSDGNPLTFRWALMRTYQGVERIEEQLGTKPGPKE